MDNAPNYLVGCVIQKRKKSMFWVMLIQIIGITFNFTKKINLNCRYPRFGHMPFPSSVGRWFGWWSIGKGIMYLLDNTPNYLVGCVIHKRLYLFYKLSIFNFYVLSMFTIYFCNFSWKGYTSSHWLDPYQRWSSYP